MKSIVVYRESDGLISCQGMIDDDAASSYGGEGLVVLEHELSIRSTHFINGEFSTSFPVDLVQEEAMVRSTRDRLLAESVIWPDTSFTGDVLKQRLVYRQKLKDITKQEGYPTTVVWPEKPS